MTWSDMHFQKNILAAECVGGGTAGVSGPGRGLCCGPERTQEPVVVMGMDLRYILEVELPEVVDRLDVGGMKERGVSRTWPGFGGLAFGRWVVPAPERRNSRRQSLGGQDHRAISDPLELVWRHAWDSQVGRWVYRFGGQRRSRLET